MLRTLAHRCLIDAYISSFYFSENVEEGKVECPDCHKMYKNPNSLHSHRKLDCGQPKKFVCQICHYKSNRKFRLTEHMNSVHLRK